MEDKKCKICRAAGEKLFLKGEKCFTTKCPITRRNYPPGIHGEKKRHRVTEYGLQLREKQKARSMYGVGERQFSNYFKKAVRSKGDSSETLIKMLELRLDNVVFRMGLASSRHQARQIVNHGHIYVNNRKVNIPSYQVSVGDTITIAPSSHLSAFFKERSKMMAKSKTPIWLTFDWKKMSGTVVSLPRPEELKSNFDSNLIIEYYSR